jgi:hypothetical protein
LAGIKNTAGAGAQANTDLAVKVATAWGNLLSSNMTTGYFKALTFQKLRNKLALTTTVTTLTCHISDVAVAV